MNFRNRAHTESIGLQLAPMIDVILFLLTFFLLTWNVARYETELDVRVPTAKQGVLGSQNKNYSTQDSQMVPHSGTN